MRILFATDGSPGAEHAADLLAGIGPLDGATLEVLHVVEAEPPFWDVSDVDPGEEDALRGIRAELEAEGAKFVANAARRLEAAGWKLDRATRSGAPAAQILAHAAETGASVVVLGATGMHEGSDALLGRTARRVLKNAEGAVLVARPRADRQGKLRVLFPFDGSPASAAAEGAIRALAPACERLTLLSVLTVATTLYRYDLVERMSATWRTHRARVERELQAIADRVRTEDLEVEVRLLDGGTDAADEVLEATRLLQPDITVVGHSGKGGLRKLVLGSVSAALAERASSSVWIAAAPADDG